MMNKSLKNTDAHSGHRHTLNRFAVIPTKDRLKANDELTGKGVRIAFLDSGFFPHPDFAPRIVEHFDVETEKVSPLASGKSFAYQWHGTQTVASCAGDGYLSNGVYSGLACDAELVLIKVSSDDGRISDDNIVRGLKWLHTNLERLSIRIVNMSFGGDYDLRTEESQINMLVESLVSRGVVVTAAAGNSENTRSIPPASSPSVITVGGFNDQNSLSGDHRELYHSSFGHTADGILKPEVIAPAMFVAAPILPATDEFDTALALSELAALPDYLLADALEEHGTTAGINFDPETIEFEEIRNMIERRLIERKVVSAHYQHVDGTSFAAPIVASVAAQMIEANPGLTPLAVKNIVISTASRLSAFDAARQGFGVVNASRAVELAKSENHLAELENLKPPFVEGESIVFSFHGDGAEKVALVGDFNSWNPNKHKFSKDETGLWRTFLELQPPGKYGYKYLINGVSWTEDPSHGYKEPDSLGGFNSVLHIAGNNAESE